ncbi:uncharacterized protein LOC129905628 [Episyrphus balteatus]|uniref:uncharacterized protein LOC129905628 n=1 Tax=Episyrphus balteatus TaxID=286459 RepID=UPI0024858B7E|nr:uncharacterized protein LOC129905628 [Episyrphus balteatus]
MVQITYVPNELTPIFCVIPLVFVFLWTLIIGDFKNFKGSRKSCAVYTAKDPVNCYQDFVQPNGKEHMN